MEFPVTTADVPYLTTDQMREVDRAIIEDYKIELIQMMENAGRNLAHLARSRFLDGDPSGKRIAVLAGTGGNGGGALVCARQLHSYGAQVSVFVTRPDQEFTPVPARQLDILHCPAALTAIRCNFTVLFWACFRPIPGPSNEHPHETYPFLTFFVKPGQAAQKGDSKSR